MKAKLDEVLQEKDKQLKLQNGAEQRHKQLQDKMQDLETELLSARVNQDGQNLEKSQVRDIFSHIITSC